MAKFSADIYKCWLFVLKVSYWCNKNSLMYCKGDNEVNRIRVDMSALCMVHSLANPPQASGSSDPDLLATTLNGLGIANVPL